MIPWKGLFNGEELCHFECINVTSLSPVLQLLAHRAYTFVQEHCIPVAKQHIWCRVAATHRLVLDLGPTDPEARTAGAAGVGACGPRLSPPRHSKAATESFAQLVQLGRGMRHLVAVGHGKVVIVYNFYGWTGGHDRPEAASRSDAGLKAIYDEISAQGDEYVMLMGDFNADHADLPTAADVLGRGWTDLGACPAWAPDGPQNTCFPQQSSVGTRRDFVLCSPKLLPFIAGFRVYFHPAILTHAVLGVAVRPHGAASFVNSVRIPRNVVPTTWDSRHQEVAFREVAQNAIQEELILRQHLVCSAMKNPEDRAGLVWKHLSIAFERGLVRTVGINPDRASSRPFLGRGKAWITRRKLALPSMLTSPTDLEVELQAVNKGEPALAAKILRSRLLTIVAVVERRSLDLSLGTLWTPHLVKSICAATHKVHGSVREKVDLKDLDDLCHVLTDGDPTSAAEILQSWEWTPAVQVRLIKIAAAQALAAQNALRDEERRRRSDRFKQRIKSRAAGRRYSFQLLKTPLGSPLSMLRGSDGVVTACPQRIDELARSALRHVYSPEGGRELEHHLLTNFLDATVPILTYLPEFGIGNVDPDRLHQIFQSAPDTAAGMDNWKPREWRCLPLEAASNLAHLYDRIETCGTWHWPGDTALASSVAIPKPATEELEVLSWRHLSVLSTLYRDWAKARLWDLGPWIKTWFPAEAYAGAWGRGAEGAWYATATTVEAELLASCMLSGAVTDIYKCFDMLSRLNLAVVLRLAGFPTRLWAAYFKMAEQRRFYLKMTQGFGQPFIKERSIPQGDPWSMMMLALILKPGITLLRHLETVPRCLADDLLLLSRGPGHAQRTSQGLSSLLAYLKLIGVIVSTAADKTFVFSERREDREWLEARQWPWLTPPHTHIAVQTDWRDLGAHIDTSLRRVNITGNLRLSRAASSAAGIGSLGLGLAESSSLVVAKVIPMGLYGVRSGTCQRSWTGPPARGHWQGHCSSWAIRQVCRYIVPHSSRHGARP